MIRRKQLCAFLKMAVILGIALAACSDATSTRTRDQEPEHEVAAWEQEFLTDPHDLSAVPLGDGERLRVVATTSIVADLVAEIGGESIDLTVLIPPGADPHSFLPTPRDYQALTDAHVIFINGVGLEQFLHETLEQVAEDVPVVSLSEGIDLRRFAEREDKDHDEGEEHTEGHKTGIDPHVWFDPLNVMIWAENIAQALGALDPMGAELYEKNTNGYTEALQVLHLSIEELVGRVPEKNRVLVSDHLVFGYFAERYGFEMLGAVIPAYSTAAEPSARELAALEETMLALDVRAVFVGESVNPKLAQRVAEDTGVFLVPLYTGSLSEPGGPAGTYLELMRYNVEAIVGALGS
ncbi:MAG: zinc ABC transporter solute-binding protein [Anaerolineales bacterium]|nr:zinc ABC transporter solute-binding protein [Anaerolineales bacterium]